MALAARWLWACWLGGLVDCVRDLMSRSVFFPKYLKFIVSGKKRTRRGAGAEQVWSKCTTNFGPRLSTRMIAMMILNKLCIHNIDAATTNYEKQICW